MKKLKWTEVARDEASNLIEITECTRIASGWLYKTTLIDMGSSAVASALVYVPDYRSAAGGDGHDKQ